MIWLCMNLQSQDRKRGEFKWHRGVTVVIAGVEAIIAALLTWIAWDTLNAQAESNVADVIQDSILFMGDDSIATRLSGAYSLYNLAEEYKRAEKKSHQRLSLHIRQTGRNSEYKRNYREKPAEDIQLVLDMLTMRNTNIGKYKDNSNPFQDLELDISGAYLAGSDFVVCGFVVGGFD